MSEALFQIVVTFDGENYHAGLDAPNSYKVKGSSPLKAVIRWAGAIHSAIGRYREGEITFDYFVKRLGVPEEVARQIIDTEEIITLSDERLKLDRLFKQD